MQTYKYTVQLKCVGNYVKVTKSYFHNRLVLANLIFEHINHEENYEKFPRCQRNAGRLSSTPHQPKIVNLPRKG